MQFKQAEFTIKTKSRTSSNAQKNNLWGNDRNQKRNKNVPSLQQTTGGVPFLPINQLVDPSLIQREDLEKISTGPAIKATE